MCNLLCYCLTLNHYIPTSFLWIAFRKTNVRALCTLSAKPITFRCIHFFFISVLASAGTNVYCIHAIKLCIVFFSMWRRIPLSINYGFSSTPDLNWTTMSTNSSSKFKLIYISIRSSIDSPEEKSYAGLTRFIDCSIWRIFGHYSGFAHKFECISENNKFSWFSY